MDFKLVSTATEFIITLFWVATWLFLPVVALILKDWNLTILFLWPPDTSYLLPLPFSTTFLVAIYVVYHIFRIQYCLCVILPFYHSTSFTFLIMACMSLTCKYWNYISAIMHTNYKFSYLQNTCIRKNLLKFIEKCQKSCNINICRILGTIMLNKKVFRPFWTCQKYHKSQILRIYAWKIYALLFHSSVSLVHFLVHLYLILVDKWGWIVFAYISIDFQKSKWYTDIILPSFLFFRWTLIKYL